MAAGDDEDPIKVGILVVSTTAAQDPSADATSGLLFQVFADQQGGAPGGGSRWTVARRAVVPDEPARIAEAVADFADGDDAVGLLVTTGGTGFAVDDRTPEVVTGLLDKQAPGLVHAMLSASLQVTPFAMMSRPAAGVRKGTVVVTLPGSPKGAKENLEAIIRTLPHACLQAAGANSRRLHAGGVGKLEEEAGIAEGQSSSAGSHDHHHQHEKQHHGCGRDHGHGGHGHGHGHGALVRHPPPATALSNDPSLGPGRRHRESPYPMLPVDEALRLIAEHTPEPSVVTARTDRAIVGAVLAEDVEAREDVPAFRASIVDGYAVVAPADGSGLSGVFPVTSVSHAAPGEDDNNNGNSRNTLRGGEVARITTGAPLPPGATSVIMVEDTILRTRTDDGAEEKEVEIRAAGVRDGDNVREVGSDVRRGAVILRKGERVSGVGGEVGLLASVGVVSARVYRRPVVGVLSTGDELVSHDERPGALRLGEVRDTNRPALVAAAREWGFEALDLGVAGDEPGALEAALRDGLRRADVLVTTGGVSMGELDLLKPTVERSLGGTIHFGRVAMKPGKPTTFATVPVKDHDSASGHRVSKAVFSLPGNPASALVTFHLFVLPSLHQQSGVSPAGLPRVPVVLAEDLPTDSRPEYHRAVVTVGRDGVLRAASTGGQRSSRVGSLRSANALLCMPGGKGKLDKGSKVEALLMSALRAEQ